MLEKILQFKGNEREEGFYMIRSRGQTLFLPAVAQWLGAVLIQLKTREIKSRVGAMG